MKILNISAYSDRNSGYIMALYELELHSSPVFLKTLNDADF